MRKPSLTGRVVLLLGLGLLSVMVFCPGIAAQKQFSYMSMWTSTEPQAKYLKDVAAAFEKNTGIKVSFTFVGRDVMNKLRAQLLKGTPPDVVDQDLTELNAVFITGGKKILAQDLSSFFYRTKGPEGQAKMMDVLPETLVKFYEKDGKLYFFPYEFVTSGFHYNKALFKANGLTPPKTWDEFIAAGEALKAKGLAPLALDGNISFYNAYYYYWLAERVCGPNVFRQAAADPTGKAWDDPGLLKAAQLAYELGKAGRNFFQNGYEGSAYPAAQGEWAAKGTSGSVLCGTWIPQETFKQTLPGFEFGFYPFPEVAGGKGKLTDVEAYLIGCAIPKDAKNAALAKEFMRFLIGKANAQKFADDTVNMSIRKDVMAPSLLKDVQPVLESAKRFHRTYDGAWSDYPEWWAKVFYGCDNNLIFGKITPQEFIRQIKQQSVEFWKNKED